MGSLLVAGAVAVGVMVVSRQLNEICRLLAVLSAQQIETQRHIRSLARTIRDADD